MKTSPKYVLQAEASPVLPSGFFEVVKDRKWKESMDSEMLALRKTETWTLVPMKLGMNILMCKWVFHQKLDELGKVECFKARLVASGMQQVNGIEVLETFTPVIKPATMKIILCFAVTWGWELRQYYVSNAFLHEVLKEDVYMATFEL